MEVILRDEVQNLGGIGDIVKVKPGYARNYLLPRGLAVLASNKNMKALEHERRVIAERAKKMLAAARSEAEKLSEVSLTFAAKVGEEEKLFGSVTSMDIAEQLKEKGFSVDKKKVLLDEPIKQLGQYEVKIKIATDVTATVKVTVEAE